MSSLPINATPEGILPTYCFSAETLGEDLILQKGLELISCSFMERDQNKHTEAAWRQISSAIYDCTCPGYCDAEWRLGRAFGARVETRV